MALATTEELDFKANVMLCDSVVAAEGKLYIQGAGWDVLQPPAYPVRLPRVGIAAAISVPYGRTNQNHRLSVRLRDEDGKDIQIGIESPSPNDPAASPTGRPLYSIEGTFNMGRPPILQGGDAQLFPFAVNIDGLILPAPGSYYIVIEIDNVEVERLRFRALGQTAAFLG